MEDRAGTAARHRAGVAADARRIPLDWYWRRTGALRRYPLRDIRGVGHTAARCAADLRTDGRRTGEPVGWTLRRCGHLSRRNLPRRVRKGGDEWSPCLVIRPGSRRRDLGRDRERPRALAG